MNRKNLWISIVALSIFCVSAVGNPAPTIPVYNLKALIDSLPNGQTWINHIDKDLMRFWTTPEALGDSLGNFPTYRAENGKVVNPGDPLPPSYLAAQKDTALFNALIKIDRSYIRAQARQTYAYGIAYHMTGKPEYLQFAKAGVDYLRKNALDNKGEKGVFSYYNKTTKKWEPENAQRTSQDLAYALTGIGFYYYLTRDAEVLPDIEKIKTHIFNTYYNKQMDLLLWVVKQSPDQDSPDQRELVSQLDQVYAYMLWLAPALPEKQQKEWIANLEQLCNLMIKNFFSTEYGMFWGQITSSSHMYIGASHTDFGHSIKTLWLIGQVGKLTGNTALLDFSRTYAKRIIEMAYLPDTKSWARSFDEKGQLDTDKEWWILAELDQMTATLALNDPSMARYLIHTYNYWLKNMVDTTYGEIWHMVSGTTNKPILKYPKVHSWKNALHSTEHALISYMTTQQLKNQPITLYYAFVNSEKETKNIRPYFFEGRVESVTPFKASLNNSTLRKNPSLEKYSFTKVQIRDLR